ncbi:MAG: ABC transporter ATP-binding protein [Phycisphaerales bacterium]|nr:ABC transporter ATP-binding protein [Phycisphaerales bacterium]
MSDRPMLLNVSNVHKTYRLGRVDVPVLRGIDLDVAEGECVAVLGASGSGKSTLLHLVGGLDRPDRGKGTITFDNAVLGKMSAHELDLYRCTTVGFVFQFYHLLPELNVLQNTMLGAMIRYGRFGWRRHRAQVRADAEALLDRFGLSHRLAHRATELSGGERQRVAIARALMNHPRLVLADEPTGNLDRATGAKVIELMLELRRAAGTTLVLVTHDAELAALADRRLHLVDGRLVDETGTRS